MLVFRRSREERRMGVHVGNEINRENKKTFFCLTSVSHLSTERGFSTSASSIYTIVKFRSDLYNAMER